MSTNFIKNRADRSTMDRFNTFNACFVSRFTEINGRAPCLRFLDGDDLTADAAGDYLSSKFVGDEDKISLEIPNQTPRLLLQIMGGQMDFVNSNILTDPTRFEAYSELERLQYGAGYREVKNCFVVDGYVAKEEPLSARLGYNCRYVFC